MIDPAHLVQYVITPVLQELNLYSNEAVNLVLGTACVESECGLWLHQLGDGPAVGIYQMEPATHNDLWAYLGREDNLDLAHQVLQFSCDSDMELAQQMTGNIYYATAMCRVHYARVPEPIPNTLIGQAQYWKTFYNSELGAGTVEDYIAAWRRFVKSDLVLV